MALKIYNVKGIVCLYLNAELQLRINEGYYIPEVIDYIKKNNIKHIELMFMSMYIFRSVFDLVDKIETDAKHYDYIINEGCGHKLYIDGAYEKHIGLIHPESVYHFTTDPRVTRMLITSSKQIPQIADREFDHLSIHLNSHDNSLEGVKAKEVKLIRGSLDINPILQYEKLEKLEVCSQFILDPIVNPQCYNLKSYKFIFCGKNRSIPELDQLIDSRRFARMKVALP